MASSVKRVPLRHGQVRTHPKHGPVFITDGAEEICGQVSNHWTFRKVLKDGRLSAREHSDRGDPRWPNAKGVEIRVVLKKEKTKKGPQS